MSLVTSTIIYFTFVNEDSCINKFFLPRDYAIKLPLLLLLIAGLGVGTFIGKVLIKNQQKQKSKKKAQ